MRGVTAFADHFDPIQFLVAFTLKIFPDFSKAALAVDIVAVLVTSLFVCRILFIKTNNLLFSLSSIPLILLSRGIVSAINYPIHPTTWSVLCLCFMLSSFFSRDRRTLILSSLLLLFFKEIFVLSVIPVILMKIFLDRKDYKVRTDIYYLLFLFAYAVMVFFYRPYILEDSYSHSSSFEDLLLNVSKFNFFDIMKIIIPISPFFYVYFKGQINKRATCLFGAFYSSIFLMHLSKGYSYYHYGALLAFPLLCFSLFAVADSKIKVSSKVIFLCVMLTLVVSGKRASRGIRAFSERGFQNSINEKLKMSQSNVEELLDAIDLSGQKIFATTGLITLHAKEGRQFYEINKYQTVKKYYDYFMFSKNKTSLIFPYSREKVEEFKQCSLKFSKEIYSDENYEILKGKIHGSCFSK